jgi:hypothetical protein
MTGRSFVPTRLMRGVVLLSAVLALVAGAFVPAASAQDAGYFVVAAISDPFEQGSSSGVYVAAYLADGSLDTNYRGTIHLTSTDSAASLPADYTFTAGDNGDTDIASGVILRTLGQQIVTVTDTSNSALTGQQTEIDVIAGGATSLQVASIVDPIKVGAASDVYVAAYNADGSLDTDFTGTVHFTSTDPTAKLPADYTFVVSDGGDHTFTAGVVLKTAGEQTVTATQVGKSTVTGSQTDITVRDREPTTTSLKAKLQPDLKLLITGSVVPVHQGIKVSISVSRGTKTINKRGLLDAAGKFKAVSKVPAGTGKCKVTASFPGDDDHKPSAKTIRVKC